MRGSTKKRGGRTPTGSGRTPQGARRRKTRRDNLLGRLGRGVLVAVLLLVVLLIAASYLGVFGHRDGSDEYDASRGRTLVYQDLMVRPDDNAGSRDGAGRGSSGGRCVRFRLPSSMLGHPGRVSAQSPTVPSRIPARCRNRPMARSASTSPTVAGSIGWQPGCGIDSARPASTSAAFRMPTGRITARPWSSIAAASGAGPKQCAPFSRRAGVLGG